MPYPPTDGGTMAMHALTQGLQAHSVNIKILGISTHKHPFDSSKLPNDYLKATNAEAVEIDTKIKPIDAFLNLFSSESYNVKRFYSKQFEEKLIAILKEQSFDFVQLETLFVTPYIETIRKYSKAKIIYRAQ